MQLVPTGPDLPSNVLHGIFLAMFHAAQRRVTIVSPYLVPTQSIVLALQTAARRGVEVNIILPAHPDNIVARLAGRSWYLELLAAGVRIYELPGSAVHSKVILIDDHLAAIGSANLDVRSFQLNFEASMLIYGPEPAAALSEQAAKAMERAHRKLLDAIRNKPFLQQVAEGACRLMAPLL
jgi:cardiolipin synthase